MELDKINSDLYCLLPPDKKQEYKNMFPEPVYLKIPKVDQSGYVWIDQELLEIPESWISSISAYSYEPCIPQTTGGYITEIKTDSRGSLAFLPNSGANASKGTIPCDYTGYPNEQRLIKRGINSHKK